LRAAEEDPMRTIYARLFVTMVLYALLVIADVLGVHA
jgi:hypothetical protein